MAFADDAPHPAILIGPSLESDTTLGALSLPELFLSLTQEHAGREAWIMRDSGTGWRSSTYAGLRAQSMAVARALIAIGVGKGERVGILMTNTPHFLASVFGAALAGAVATVLSTFSTRDELQDLLQRSCCSVLLYEPRVLRKDFSALLCDIEPAIAAPSGRCLASTRLPFLRTLATSTDTGFGRVQGWSAFLEAGARVSGDMALARARSICPSDPGMLFFSSGSTSTPKGILHSHRAVCTQLWRMQTQQGLPDGVRSWTANGFFWSGNFAMVVGATLVAGGSLVLQPTFDPGEALEIISACKASFLFAWPHQWTQLVEAPEWDRVDLSAVRQIDPDCPVAHHPSIVTEWLEPRYCYGNTETLTLVTGFPAGTTAEQSRGSHGRPLPGNTVRIVDPVGDTVMRLGERGEIAVKGPTLMLGYLGIPLDETLDEQGFFRTGDGGYLDENGLLYWEGRLNDLIKTGGANVSPLEVDEVLRTCPGVKLCQTVGVPHETLGEQVVSCIVLETGAGLSEQAVREHARSKLASYKVPRRVLFLQEGEVELTGSAKIRTSELRRRAAALLER